MRTLSRYFVARYVGLFAAILCFAALAIASVELLLGPEGLDGPQDDALQWVLWRIPSYYLGDLVPISSFFAAFFTIGLAVRWLEWTAVQASGIAPGRIMLPLVGAAIVVAVAMGLVRETVGTAALQRYAAAQRASDEDLLFRDGSFWYQKGSSIFSIRSADASTETLRGVEVFERTPRGRLLADIHADHATVRSDGTWVLHDAIVRRFDPDRPEAPTRVDVEPVLEISVSDSSALLLEQTDAAALPLPQLAEYIAVHAADDHPGSGQALHRLQLLLQSRLSEPALVVALSLLALPIALLVRPGGAIAPAGVVAIAAIGLFFLARNVVHGLALRAVLASPAVVWTVPVAISVGAIAALWIETRRTRP